MQKAQRLTSQTMCDTHKYLLRQATTSQRHPSSPTSTHHLSIASRYCSSRQLSPARHRLPCEATGRRPSIATTPSHLSPGDQYLLSREEKC
ncbi:unnamed protein product [Lactuca virosa]|uniref:Uncharacterized protein n=1 Tax=Lactuca virosa TaxID=75947 RepID=A0AAU9MNF7_9ASTR|nr:unnamed protein product [Lactuca virosa]